MKKDPEKKVPGEELVGSDDVDPRARVVGVWVEKQALQLVFCRKLVRDLVGDLGRVQLEVRVEVTADRDGS